MIDMQTKKLSLGRTRSLALWAHGHNYDGNGPADRVGDRPLTIHWSQRVLVSHMFAPQAQVSECGQQVIGRNNSRGRPCRTCRNVARRDARLIRPVRVEGYQ